jgi:hypothetical protein
MGHWRVFLFAVSSDSESLNPVAQTTWSYWIRWVQPYLLLSFPMLSSAKSLKHISFSSMCRFPSHASSYNLIYPLSTSTQLAHFVPFYHCEAHPSSYKILFFADSFWTSAVASSWICTPSTYPGTKKVLSASSAPWTSRSNRVTHIYSIEILSKHLHNVHRQCVSSSLYNSDRCSRSERLIIYMIDIALLRCR